MIFKKYINFGTASVQKQLYVIIDEINVMNIYIFFKKV